MKNLLLLAVAALLCAGCSSDDEPQVSEIDEEVSAVLQVLNGHFAGEKYSETLNTTEHYEYTFTPYQQPREVTNLFYSGTGKYTASGTVHESHYFNDHLMQVDRDYYYNVLIQYKGATPKLSLFRHNEEGNISGLEEVKSITVVTSASITVDGFAMTKQ